MNRQFFRTYEELQKQKENKEKKAPDQLNIGVTGLGRSTGTTMIASALAFYFADMGKKVQFTQCLNPARPEALLFDGVAMDQRFKNRVFHDVYQLILEDQSIRGKSNMEKGVNWILPTPEVCKRGEELDDSQKARLVQNGRSEICIFDFEADGSWDRFLMDMDLNLVVADPLPSKLICSAQRFKILKKLELSGCRTLWAVNRVNSGVNRRQVAGYLKTGEILWVKCFPEEEIYGDEYACRFHWENDAIKSQLMEIFTKISQEWGIL